MKTELRVHEGLKGSGVVCSLTYDKHRILFDFGAPFRPDLNAYDGYVLHREKSALLDALRLKETPPVDSIYNKKDLTLFDGSIYQNIQPYEESDITSCVIISHLHLDHMANIKYLHKDIPVYMHKNGKKLLDVLEDINEGTYHETVVGVEYEEPFMHGPFKITPHFNDHPCHGSTSYYIEAPDGKFLYTGDIRFHGLSRERAFEEIEKLGQKEIDVAIVDGTSYSPSKFIHNPEKINELSQPSKGMLEGMFLEQKIYDDIRTQLHDYPHLGLFNIYHRDMQLINALDTLGRTVVYEVETAYVINKTLDKKVCFYVQDANTDEAILNYVKEHNDEVSFEELHAHPEKYFVQVSYKNILHVFSLPAKDGIYFHLFGDPFGKAGCDNLAKILNMTGTKYVGYSNVYSFNHAFPNHLSWMIQTLGPKNIVCVHSNNPEKLNAMGAHHVLPEQNEAYIIENEVLVKA